MEGVRVAGRTPNPLVVVAQHRHDAKAIRTSPSVGRPSRAPARLAAPTRAQPLPVTTRCTSRQRAKLAKQLPSDEVSALMIRAGTCPTCSGPLTAAERSPGGWRHCWRCRVGWKAERSARRHYYPVVKSHPKERMGR
jgi:hypothetical protein